MWINFYSIYRNGILVLCVFLSIGAAALGVRTALKAGPVWDDPIEIVMLNINVAIGVHPELSYETGKEWMEKNGGYGSGFYGVMFQYLAHGVHTIASGEPWAQTEHYTAKNIAWRHLVAFLLALCAAGALFLTVGIVSGSWALGLTMLAVLLSTPVSLGLSNFGKDSPIASGLTLFSCGAALLLWRLSFQKGPADRPTKRLMRPWAANTIAAIMIFLGTLVAFGTRTGAVALLAVEGAIVGALLLLELRKSATRVMSAAGIMLAAISAGIFLAVFLNPLARKAPFQWIFEGVKYAANKYDGAQNLKVYDQMVVSNALPWWYVPGWIIAEYPAAFLALFVLGGFGAIRLLWRTPMIAALYPWVPFVVQGLVLPLCIIISHAVIYDRLRHLTFIVPPLCMLAGFGLYLCFDSVRAGSRWVNKALAVAGPVLLLIIFANTAIWYPYQYAYLSEFARSFPQFAFDVDYLGLTIAESIERMRQHGVKTFRAGPAPVFLSFDPKETGVAIDYVSRGYPLHPDPVQGGGAYYLHSRPSWNAAGLPDFCRTLFKIERQGVILGVGGEC
jgi:hypothetical protein